MFSRFPLRIPRTPSHRVWESSFHISDVHTCTHAHACICSAQCGIPMVPPLRGTPMPITQEVSTLFKVVFPELPIWNSLTNWYTFTHCFLISQDPIYLGNPFFHNLWDSEFIWSNAFVHTQNCIFMCRLLHFSFTSNMHFSTHKRVQFSPPLSVEEPIHLPMVYLHSYITPTTAHAHHVISSLPACERTPLSAPMACAYPGSMSGCFHCIPPGSKGIPPHPCPHASHELSNG